MSVVTSPSGWVFDTSQENGDNVDCLGCGNGLDDNQPIYTNREGFAFCSESCILADHDAGEELHGYIPAQDEDDVSPRCRECGDDESGVMHYDTDRDISPLLWDGVPDCGEPGPDCVEHAGACD